MNSFALLLMCVLACVQNVMCVPCGASTYPRRNSNNAIIDSYIAQPHYIHVFGDRLVIEGKAQVSGHMPFASSVQLSGNVPATGSATIKNACNCGDAYLH